MMTLKNYTRNICSSINLRFFILFVFPGILVSCNRTGEAELILTNGKIVTVDSNFSIVQALAVKGDRILATGTDEEIKKLAGKNCKVIDLQGRMAIPGLYDGHAHPQGAALSEISEEIPNVHDIPELLAEIKRQSTNKKPGEWIIFPKLFFTRLKELHPPSLKELDSVAPANPVFMDGSYGGMINTAAMRVSGINRNTTNEGIIRDKKTNLPTGLIKSSAFTLLPLPHQPSLSEKEKEQLQIKMLKGYNAYGITSICSGGEDYSVYEMYKNLSEKNLLTVRIFQNILIDTKPGISFQRLIDSIKNFRYKTGDGDSLVKIGTLKIVLDGGILTGTAYMREPWGKKAAGIYGITDTTYKGRLNYSHEDLLAIVTAANELGWKFTAHCTGGGGVDLLLDVFEEVNRNNPIRKNRFSIIHGNFFTKEAIRRMHDLGVYADMQPAWFYKDADAMELILGDNRITTFHPYHSLIAGGVMINGGSDHMVKFDGDESINPFNPYLGMYAMITHTTERKHTIVPDEAISRKEALKIYTINNAYASFDEKIKGSLEAGKLADMAVLSDDLLECPVENIKKIKSELTLLGGKIVFSSGKIKQ